MKTFTVNYNTSHKITVEAETEEEAYELAMDEYDKGYKDLVKEWGQNMDIIVEEDYQ